VIETSHSEGRLAEVRFLTVAEVAELMRVSKMTVYRLVHAGDLSAVRVGRSFRVPEHCARRSRSRPDPISCSRGLPARLLRLIARKVRGDSRMGSVVKKRRKRMAKKKHRKLLRKTRVQRRRLGK
jgi:excisionase family DNA binding protein